MLTDKELAILQRGNTEELRALIYSKDILLENKDKTIAWQRDIINNDLKDIANASIWTKNELERKRKNAQKTGRNNQRNGEKNNNGRKTDAKLKNQLMSEVKNTMERNSCSQSNACKIVAGRHLKTDGKTPIYSKRTIENWMSTAKRNRTKK